MEQDFTIEVKIADESHFGYAEAISRQIEESAAARGTGIAKRSPEYLRSKMTEGKAIIGTASRNGETEVCGFCYIESWGHNQFVANSGLIVFPKFRSQGLAKLIKKAAFDLSLNKFPGAKLFGLTTNLAVMTINAELGYRPVTFSELTSDDAFWKGCESCVNHEILVKKDRKNCLCTAMLFAPKPERKSNDKQETHSRV
ncbi:MAG: GNAT family N-acetyltransferase [Oligoflexales bacterium]